MDEGSERLLGEMDDSARYSAMEMENKKSPESGNLMDSNEAKHSTLKINKRALVIFFGVIVVAVAVIVVSVVVALYSGGLSGSSINRSKREYYHYSMDDVFLRKYDPDIAPVQWISDDSYQKEVGGEILSVDVTTGESKVLISKKIMDSLEGTHYLLSPDKKFILYRKNSQNEFRYSTFADYYVYDISTGKSDKIATKDNLPIQYTTWAPSKNSLTFVVENDMYYIGNIVSMPLPAAHRLTASGKKHKIFNGVPDWVYQEEVLNTDNALYFSPDSRYVAYIQFNDSDVTNYVYPWYGSPANSYPSQKKIAYPKSGTPNPTIKVKVIDTANLPADSNTTPKPSDVEMPSIFKKVNHYVVNIAWASGDSFTVQWLNRFQDHLITRVCKVKGSAVSCDEGEGHEQKVKDGWVDDRYKAPLFAKDLSYYLVMLPSNQGKEVGDFLHIAKVEVKGGKVTFLTGGEWEVTKILIFDDEKEIVYFESTKESPLQRHIYKVTVGDLKMECLTCNLIQTRDRTCLYYSAEFSKKGSYFSLNCKGPEAPRGYLYKTNQGKVLLVRDLPDNREEVETGLASIGKAVVEYRTVRSGGYDIHVKLIKPPTFDPNKKYAVLFSVYGGPGTQNVMETFQQLGFEAYLVRNYDIIVAYLDARGTMGRGERFKHAVYRDLGKREADDTINAAWNLSREAWVNEEKMSIWGWSYGGYLTSFVLGTNGVNNTPGMSGKKQEKVFKLGMAVAPVADWKYYDSIYTERYMGLPKENKIGYKDSSVLPLLQNYKGLHYLLVHGTGDDNVHFQNSAQIVKKLTELEVDYRVQYYVDKNHGLPDYHTKHHLFTLMEHFLENKLHISDHIQARCNPPYPPQYPQYPTYPNYPQYPWRQG